jgi:dTMP kinase
MAIPGKLIALEGIDGSGKRTQMEMLTRAFATRGIAFAAISFPRYDGFFGEMVARFLNGDFGPLETVNPHFSALLYAGDRLEFKPEIEAALEAGKIVLADRYIASNLAHQGARVPAEKRTDFLKWLRQVEYGIYGLPAEELVVYLRVPAEKALQLIGKKGKRQYTRRRRDLQEANLAHLKAASDVYDELAHQANWVKIECAETQYTHGPRQALRQESRLLRSPEAIHAELLAAIDARFGFGSASKG